MTAPVAAATPHITALIARLKAQLPGTIAVYDAEVPGAPAQAYAVVWATPGARTRDSMSTAADRWEATPQITCVGTSERQCVDVADRVAAALSGHQLVVPGRQCWPITEIPLDQPVQRDDAERDPTTQRPRFFVPTQWRIASIPLT